VPLRFLRAAANTAASIDKRPPDADWRTPPVFWRSRSNPASGRSSRDCNSKAGCQPLPAARVRNPGTPVMVESGRGLPNFSKANAADLFFVRARNRGRIRRPTPQEANRLRRNFRPIPSPGREVTRSCIKSSIRLQKYIRGNAIGGNRLFRRPQSACGRPRFRAIQWNDESENPAAKRRNKRARHVCAGQTEATK